MENINYPDSCNFCGKVVSGKFYCSDECFYKELTIQVSMMGIYVPYVPFQVSKITPEPLAAVQGDQNGTLQKEKKKERWYRRLLRYVHVK